MDSKSEIVFQYAKKQASKHPTHDWHHTMRVWVIAEQIALDDIGTVNLEILELAVYLHDIARQEEDDSNSTLDHALLGSKKAKELLQTLNYPDEIIKGVCHCIEAHRFRKNKKDEQPSSIEAKILFDADKLDSIGAVGIARAFLYAGENGYQLYRDLPKDYNGGSRNMNPDIHTANIEYEVKLKHIEGLLLTKSGRKIAKERNQFMKNFFDQLEEEMKGIK
jgi:uncharacterized protein